MVAMHALQLAAATTLLAALPAQWQPLPAVPFEPRPIELFACGDHAVAVAPPWMRDHETIRVASMAADRVWTALPAPPLSPRQHLLLRAVGDRLVAFGGQEVKTGKWCNDGAMLDPRTGLWTAMSACPVPGRQHHGVAVDGSRLAIAAGTADQYRTVNGEDRTELHPQFSAAWFDAVTNRWTRLPDLPRKTRLSPLLTFVGDRLVLWGGNGPAAPGQASPRLADGAVLTPGERAWQALADAPAAFGTGPATIASDGKRVLVFARTLGWYAGGAVLDLDARSWTPLPRREDFGVSPGICHAHGERLFLYSGRLSCSKPPEHDAWSWRARDGFEQVQLPSEFEPREMPGVATSGARIAILGGALTTAKHTSHGPQPAPPNFGKRYGDGIVVDVESGAMHYLPTGPLGTPEAPALVFWNGGLLAVGGHRQGREWFTTAAMFVLPR